MSRRITITEKQLEELKNKLNELTLNGDEVLNAKGGNIDAATRETLRNAQDDGVNINNAAVNVAYSQDGLKQNGITAEWKCLTKKQIKEAKLANLKKNCTVYKKKDLK